MIRQIAFWAILVVSSPALFGQETQSTGTFSYDPSFWASELKLDAEQRNRIQAINADFYEHLKDRPNLEQLREYLHTRQELILDTFHNRQKRKWEKIISSL
ncbi:MAG: hypothetical protein KIT62_11945 [Cyclobacteriaceae bacterium]|nr:hypothetical protein [Cyclobacteriaceae bacterium]